jgi:hypothetical protein
MTDSHPPALALTRRDALRGIAASAFACGAGAPVVAAAPKPLFDFAIAGGAHHGLYDVIRALAPGVRLDLVREPENPYDANAIAVHLGGRRLGYVPRCANAELARLLDEGGRVVAEVERTLDADNRGDDFAFTSYYNGDPLIRLTLGESVIPQVGGHGGQR